MWSLSAIAHLMCTPQHSQNSWSQLIKCRVVCRSTWYKLSLRTPGPPGGLVRMQDLLIPIDWLVGPVEIENYDTTGISVKVKILVSWQPLFWANPDSCLYIVVFNIQFEKIVCFCSAALLHQCTSLCVNFVPRFPSRPTAVLNMYGLRWSWPWCFSVCPPPPPFFFLAGTHGICTV